MVGSTIGHYRIDAELGRGGMGVVYRAFDTKLRRNVALKLLRSERVGDDRDPERILAEARAASPLNHPGIATIYEVSEHDEFAFIVMELIEGTSLRVAMRERNFRPRALARLGTQISDALDAAHARGVVHGDIKPENIALCEDGNVKLLDFGVARHLASEAATASISGSSLPGVTDEQLAGTVAYMAPEQFTPGASPDPRSDLFSLGVMLYEMAAGHLPFPGPAPPNFVAQILHSTPEPLQRADASLPGELVRIVDKLLEKDPHDRHQSARETKVSFTNLERELEQGPSVAAAVAGRRSVAVLPFRLLTPSPDDDYLRLALADALISGLSASDRLLLRPSSSVSRYAGGNTDPLSAARELAVDVIVDGSIQRLGQALRAHVQVWDAKDGSTLLSVKHDADVADLFALQDRIAESLYQALGVDGNLSESPPTTNPRAYELYLRAVERLSHANRWDTRTAIEMLNTVVGLDPTFADAWSRLAQGCVMMAWAFEPERAWFERAETAIERALSLDPRNVDARVAKARVLWSPEHDYANELALRVLGEAVTLDPNSHQAVLWQSLVFLHVGLLDEARAGLSEVLAREPDDPFAINFLGQTLEYTGDLDAAEDCQVRALALDPTHIFANLFHPTVLIRKGQLDRAERSIQTASKILGRDQMLVTSEALIWAIRGDEGASAGARGRGMRRRSDTRTHASLPSQPRCRVREARETRASQRVALQGGGHRASQLSPFFVTTHSWTSSGGTSRSSGR